MTVSVTINFKQGEGMSFSVSGESMQEVFPPTANCQELVNACSTCKLCGSTDTIFTVFEHNGNDITKGKCQGCKAEIDIGKRKDGKTMFVNLKDKQGNYKPDGGWYHYEKKQQSQPQQQSYQPPQQSIPDDEVPF